jgi:hypothetical protein
MTLSSHHRLVVITVLTIMAWSLLSAGLAQAMPATAPVMHCQGAAAHQGDHAGDSGQHPGAGCHCIQTCQTVATPGIPSDGAWQAPLVSSTPVPGQRLTGFPASPWRPPTP